MPLDRAVIPVSFTQGLATKEDPKQLLPGKLTVLENGTFISPKRVRKRNGYAALATAKQTGGNIAAGSVLASLGNKLVLGDGQALYSWAPSEAAWEARGSLTPLGVSRSMLYDDTVPTVGNGTFAHTCAYHAGTGLTCYVWGAGGLSSAQFNYSIVDSATGERIVYSGTAVASNAINAKVFTLGSYFVVLYVNSATNTLNYVSISTAAPHIVSASTQIGASVNTNAVYDAQVVYWSGVYRLVAAFANSTPAISLAWVSSALGSPIYTLTVTTGALAATAICVAPDPYTGNSLIGYYDGTSVQRFVVSFTGTTVQAVAAIATVANVARLTAASISSAATLMELFYSTRSTGSIAFTAASIAITGSTYAAASPSALPRQLCLVSQAFAYNGRAYAIFVNQSGNGTSAGIQYKYFVLDHAGNIVGVLLSDLGGMDEYLLYASPAAYPLHSVASAGSASFIVPLVSPGGAEVNAAWGAYAVSIVFGAQGAGAKGQLANSLHISGGILSAYSGSALSEHGFLLYPENLSVANPGGAYSYQYAAIYVWPDGNGVLHRSAPSIPVTQAQASAIDGTHTVAVTVGTLRLSAKTNAIIEIYRTVANGTVFYRIASVLNNPSVDTVSYTDAFADSQVQGNIQLYTTGEVEDICAPACRDMLVADNRIYLVAAEAPCTIWYSKQVLEGSPVEFSDLFTWNVDTNGGDIVALAYLDGKKIVFKSSAIYWFMGSGPSASGENNDFTAPQLLPFDVGAVSAASVLTTSAGVIFQSSKGFWLLDRGLGVSYIGADVEAYNGQTVTSSALIPQTTQARFTLASGQALVYDYFVGQWSVFTNLNAADSTIWQGDFCYLQPGGTVMQETPGTFSDAGSYIALRVVTGWLNLVALQGFQRLRRILVLGDWVSAHNLVVGISSALDSYSSPITQSDTILATAAPEQYRINLVQQKCEAVQISLTEQQNGGTIGEGLTLSGLTLEVGLKKGTAKLPSSRSFG